jgi:hypothetical protein
MFANDRRQDEQIEEIKALLKDVLKDQVMNHLKTMINDTITKVLEEEVRKGVQEELEKTYMRKELVEQVEGQKGQLDEVRRALWNS